ncbi:MAG: endonuclease YncB(thermonuclease family) [Rickettsiales bacterium]|jgi:endonuclease YncB( thermonuclease family)
MENNILSKSQYSKLSSDLITLILNTKNKLEEFAKNQMIETYWQIGARIDEEHLSQNANYYSSITKDLGRDLEIDERTLRRCVQFFKTYPNSPPSQNSLSWSHYKYLLSINDSKTREEVEKKAADEKWNVFKLGNEIKNLKNREQENGKSKITRPTKANYLYKAQIIDVIDGDTLLLNVDLGFEVIKKQRVRLAQIDAPEMKSEAGEESFKYLRDLAAKLKFVVIRTNKIDIYGRYLGDVFYPNISDGSRVSNEKTEVFEKGIYLNEQLLEKGFAKMF